MSAPLPPSVRYIVPNTTLPDISPTNLSLLRRKQHKLARTYTNLEAEVADIPHHLKALKSTLIFAQHEAGTAVNTDPRGYLLTCSHCIGESEEEWQANKRKWLLTYQGTAVQAECQFWDSKRDLALLNVIAVETTPSSGFFPLSQLTISARAPKLRSFIFCIGQPGAEDLESESYRETKYNLFEISEGRYRGMRKGVDPQDNEEIGVLKHDAWTYWGHSGAPLCAESDGGLIGLHSSWDEETGIRHGVPGVAIEAFLKEYLPGLTPSVDDPGSLGSRDNVIDLTDEI